MERPSHLSLSIRNSQIERMTRALLAAGAPALVLFGLTHGMGTAVLTLLPPDLHARVLDDKPVKPVPAPEIPKLEKPKVVDVPLPIVTFDAPRDTGPTITAATPTIVPQTPVTPPAGESRAALAVAGTHTSPPYPVLARRQGLEGKVILRLSILRDGHVGKADIATSSGSDLLDNAAAAWITAHWLYKPALKDGQAVASQATASVAFTLQDQR
jgi:protein TonB